eukprot:scaffold936_cov106-Amphora_coffeaeformis.AAC.26
MEWKIAIRNCSKRYDICLLCFKLYALGVEYYPTHHAPSAPLTRSMPSVVRPPPQRKGTGPPPQA